mmetsp:Transcript_16573/g.56507  ORF Transcript_16573/g.56507 Transcript_16573/m.56507 type:complete len:335 (+) Transcript_16573:3-1007(+)
MGLCGGRGGGPRGRPAQRVRDAAAPGGPDAPRAGAQGWPPRLCAAGPEARRPREGGARHHPPHGRGQHRARAGQAQDVPRRRAALAAVLCRPAEPRGRGPAAAAPPRQPGRALRERPLPGEAREHPRPRPAARRVPVPVLGPRRAHAARIPPLRLQRPRGEGGGAGARRGRVAERARGATGRSSGGDQRRGVPGAVGPGAARRRGHSRQGGPGRRGDPPGRLRRVVRRHQGHIPVVQPERGRDRQGGARQDRGDERGGHLHHGPGRVPALRRGLPRRGQGRAARGAGHPVRACEQGDGRGLEPDAGRGQPGRRAPAARVCARAAPPGERRVPPA